MDNNLYNELFEAGKKAQLEQMERFEEEKGGWFDIDLRFGSDKLREKDDEVSQSLTSLLLRQAGYDEGMNVTKEEIKEYLHIVRRKAAHSANFAHMIILKCDKELKKLI